jgi:hypothetical protein
MDVGVRRRAEPVAGVEPVRVGSRECPAAKPLELRMGEDTGDKELAQAATAEIFST